MKRKLKIIAVAVCSADGFIMPAHGGRVMDWSSKEDSEHFFTLIQKASGIIMGRKTWQENQDLIKLSPQTLRTVITREPRKYERHEVSGQLIFRDELPEKIISMYQNLLHHEVLLVGGSNIFSLFALAGLIDELLLTVEPILFGTGLPLFSKKLEQLKMSVLSRKQLNKQGSVLYRYKIS